MLNQSLGLGLLSSKGVQFDPHFASVVLLLHFDGSNGSTTIVDSSPVGNTVTCVGTAAISTAESKWGGSSGKGANNSYFNVALGATNGSMTGDFTIEGWTRGSFAEVYLMAVGAGYLYNSAFQSYGGPNVAMTALGGSLVWQHWAISRVGSTVRGFVNNVLTGTQTYAGTVNLQTLRLGMYVPNGNLYFTGNHDDIRITKGVGRYTDVLLPAVAGPFPNQ